MKRYMLLVLLATFAFASSVQAQGIFGFFNRKRPDPASHVPELIYKLKASRSYRERLVAADELRQYDPQQFPDIVPALVDALRTDTHYRVRLEAAQSLGRIRPINQAAGAALQQAASADQAWRVRLQAWSSLKVYQMAGYRSG